jgi:hypothetical protein
MVRALWLEQIGEETFWQAQCERPVAASRDRATLRAVCESALRVRVVTTCDPPLVCRDRSLRSFTSHRTMLFKAPRMGPCAGHARGERESGGPRVRATRPSGGVRSTPAETSGPAPPESERESRRTRAGVT